MSDGVEQGDEPDEVRAGNENRGPRRLSPVFGRQSVGRRMTRVAMVTYGASALALPLVAFLAQPKNCFWHLYWPSVLGWLALLPLTTAGAQPFARVPKTLRVITAFVFGVAIQASVLIPCVSELDESARVMRLALLVLMGGLLAAAALAVSVVGLLRVAPLMAGRAFTALGLAVAALSLALGATKQYVGITGVPMALPEQLIVAPFPVLLQAGLGITVLGLTIAMLQRQPESA